MIRTRQAGLWQPAEITKRIAHIILGDYEFYAIYCLDLDPLTGEDPLQTRSDNLVFRRLQRTDLDQSADSGLRNRAYFTGDGAYAFGLFHYETLVCAQFYWYGARYSRERNFWPLEATDAKSIDFYTVPGMRGRGLGPTIKACSVRAMKAEGFRRVFSRVWHSHAASRRANAKAGWGHIATVVQIYPFGFGRRVRLVLHHQP